MSQWFERSQQSHPLRGDGLDDFRQQALESLAERAMPTRKTEAWRYLNLKGLDSLDLPRVSEVESQGHLAPMVDGLNGIDITFVNGKLVTELDQLVFPEGLTVEPITRVSEVSQSCISDLLGKIKPRSHLFGQVNDAQVDDGLLIRVAADTKINQPIRIIFNMTASVERHQRVLVQLEQGAELEVIEQCCGNVNSFNTLFSEFEVGCQARLKHYRLALQSASAKQVAGCHFRLDKEARLSTNIIGYGSELARLDVDVIHVGEQTNAELNAVYLLEDEEVFDLHTNVEHTVPNGTTSETIRGIAANHSKAVFNGRIHIHRDAQKTLAELSNKNLLLSNTAQVNTKPELEIYADDVRCAHGATIAQLDDKALYYLCSRGISKTRARVMMNFGFINAVVETMPNEALSAWLKEILELRFAQLDY